MTGSLTVYAASPAFWTGPTTGNGLQINSLANAPVIIFAQAGSAQRGTIGINGGSQELYNFVSNVNSGSFNWYTNTSTQIAKLNSTGNLTLQNGGTFTDAGYRLDVVGTTRISNTLNVGTSFRQGDNTGQIIVGATSYAGAITFANNSGNNFGLTGYENGATIGDFVIKSAGGSGILGFILGGTRVGQFFNNGNFALQNGGTFTDAGYRLDVSGSTRLNGNTQITGSLTVITGSNIEFQVTNTGVKIGNVITDTHTVTGSLNISGSTTATSFTGSLLGTSSYATNALTASYALVATSASYAATASVASTTFGIGATIQTYSSVASSIVGSNNLFSPNTGSYTSAFFKYTARNGANTRAGEVIAAWNGATTTYTDFSTVDIGNTSAVTSSVSIVSGQVQFNIQTNTSGWAIKSIGTFM
jgi:hypothetical protein